MNVARHPAALHRTSSSLRAAAPSLRSQAGPPVREAPGNNPQNGASARQTKHRAVCRRTRPPAVRQHKAQPACYDGNPMNRASQTPEHDWPSGWGSSALARRVGLVDCVEY